MHRGLVWTLGFLVGMVIDAFFASSSFSMPYKKAYNNGFSDGLVKAHCDDQGGTLVNGDCMRVLPLEKK